MEYELETAQALHERVQKDLNAECQATQLLTKADNIMENCLAKMNQTLGYNTWGMSIYDIEGFVTLIDNGDRHLGRWSVSPVPVCFYPIDSTYKQVQRIYGDKYPQRCPITCSAGRTVVSAGPKPFTPSDASW